MLSKLKINILTMPTKTSFDRCLSYNRRTYVSTGPIGMYCDSCFPQLSLSCCLGTSLS